MNLVQKVFYSFKVERAIKKMRSAPEGMERNAAQREIKRILQNYIYEFALKKIDADEERSLKFLDYILDRFDEFFLTYRQDKHRDFYSWFTNVLDKYYVDFLIEEKALIW